MLAFQTSLLLTVFCYGLRASVDDVLYLVKRPGLLARSFVAMFVAMPIVVVTLVRIFNLPHTLEVCLVALAISPVPPAMPKKTIRIGGRHEYSLGLLAIMSLLSIVVVPLALNLLGRYFGSPFATAPAGIAKIVLIAAILPLIVGMIVQHVFPRVADRIEKPVGTVAGAILSAAALVLIGGTWSTLWSLAASRTLIAITTVVLVGLSIGHLMGGPAPDNRIVLALASASRHPGIALALASANFPEESFGGTILLYLLVSAIVCIPYVKWQQQELVSAVPA